MDEFKEVSHRDGSDLTLAKRIKKQNNQLCIALPCFHLILRALEIAFVVETD